MTGRGLRGPVAAGLLGATALAAGAYAVSRAVGARSAPPGKLVELPDGSRLHATWHAEGAGPVVVFENALLSAMPEWFWVTDHLGSSVPFLAYDRSGTGWSPRAPRRTPSAAGDHARRLRQLLEAAELPPPYVLVGHSVGGLLIRGFAAEHPTEVAGLVFVDASHPDQFERSRVQRESLPVFRQNLLLGRVRAATGGMYRALECSHITRLPESVAETTRRRLARPGPWAGAAHELNRCLHGWNDEARGLTTVGTAPVAVVTAGRTVRGDAVHGRLQEELAGLSEVGRHEVVEKAGHEDLVMDRVHARVVADAITWVRERAVGTPGGTAEEGNERCDRR
ncbi:alpha/beta fold hydrolase [Streptomyces sp. NPDC006435]|uniref:alpha/beta fold hydrolase n=1 Tax=Streptomyces sp. NPDC006435 TaxID=3154300 RepID=UPI0033A02D52